MLTVLVGLFAVGFAAAALLGTQAYFRGEQTKPIHMRNWRSASFERLSESLTGSVVDFGDRVPAYGLDAYASRELPTR